MPYSNDVEILLVEDNLRALRSHHLANHMVHVKDGQEALDWRLVNQKPCPPA